MQARMKNPVMVVPGTMDAIQSLNKAVSSAGLSQTILELAHLRASQINGCGACVHIGIMNAQKAGESLERLVAVSAWRESPLFTDADRAALALAEAATRLSDRADAVPDDVWDEASAHFDEAQLAALILMIAMTNFFNRVNVTIRQPAVSTW